MNKKELRRNSIGVGKGEPSIQNLEHNNDGNLRGKEKVEEIAGSNQANKNHAANTTHHNQTTKARGSGIESYQMNVNILY